MLHPLASDPKRLSGTVYHVNRGAVAKGAVERTRGAPPFVYREGKYRKKKDGVFRFSLSCEVVATGYADAL